MGMHVDELHAHIWPISGGPYLGLSPGAAGSGPSSASARINREIHPGKLIPTPAENGSYALLRWGGRLGGHSRKSPYKSRASCRQKPQCAMARPALETDARTLPEVRALGVTRAAKPCWEFADQLNGIAKPVFSSRPQCIASRGGPPMS